MRVPTMVQQIAERRRHDAGVKEIDVRKIRGDDGSRHEEAAFGGGRRRRLRKFANRDADQRVRDVVQALLPGEYKGAFVRRRFPSAGTSRKIVAGG